MCEGQEVSNSGHLVAEKMLQHASLHIIMKRLDNYSYFKC